jgi:hypothetical protein
VDAINPVNLRGDIHISGQFPHPVETCCDFAPGRVSANFSIGQADRKRSEFRI